MNMPKTSAVVACLVYFFAAFVLYITRTPGGDLSTAAVALCGPLVTAVTVYYFHSEATSTGAAISATGAAAGAAAATGQSATVKAA